MRQLTAFMLLMILLAGCASTRRPVRISYSQRQSDRLAAAMQLLGREDSRGAMNLLAAICAEPGVPGVTDEAFFRLALVQLGSANETEEPHPARQTLERLQKEYPTSSWSRQAPSILALLTAQSDLRRANRDLETLNLSLGEQNRHLTRERNELREKLDKLKNLDLELESKGR